MLGRDLPISGVSTLVLCTILIVLPFMDPTVRIVTKSPKVGQLLISSTSLVKTVKITSAAISKWFFSQKEALNCWSPGLINFFSLLCVKAKIQSVHLILLKVPGTVQKCLTERTLTQRSPSLWMLSSCSRRTSTASTYSSLMACNRASFVSTCKTDP